MRCAEAVLLVTLLCSLPRPALSGANPIAKVAVHVMPHDDARTCNSGLPDIQTCDDIVSRVEGCGDIDFFPVFLDLQEYQGVEYGATWPGSGSCAFTSCSDLKIGDIVRPGDGISQVWTACRPGPVAIPGWGWVSVAEPGEIRITPHPRSYEITVGDCSTELDNVGYAYYAGVCGALGDDPCGWGYNPIHLSKHDDLGGECAVPGRDLGYTIDYDSWNFNNLHEVVLVDYLPAGTEFVSATGGGLYEAGQHTVTWQIGTLAQYTGGSVEIVVHVSQDVTYGTELTNRCEITSLETGPSYAEMRSPVCSGELERLGLAKSDDVDGLALPGDRLVYAITYDNLNNPASVYGVTLIDSLPPEVVFVEATDDGAYESAGHTVTWDLGTLAAGIIDSVTITADILATTEPGAAIINHCRIRSLDTPWTDAAETTNVHEMSFGPLVLTKRATGSSGDAFPGDDITYTLGYSNKANVYEVHGVVLTDSLPDGMVFISANLGGAYYAGSHTVVWEIGTLGPGASGTRQVVARVPLETPPWTWFTNVCEVVSDEAGRSRAVVHTRIAGSGWAMLAVHVAPHSASRTCAGTASQIDGCEDVVTTAEACDVDVFPVFFELFEYSGIAYGLTWPSEWGEMTFTSCSDLTEGGIVSSGDGVSHRWDTCQRRFLAVPGYGRLSATGPGLVTITPHPATGWISLTTCRGYEYPLDPAQIYCFRAGVCGAAGDDVDCGGPQSVVPTTWGTIKGMFK